MKKKSSVTLCLVVSVFVFTFGELLIARPACAQVANGSISGTVVDQSGAVVAGAAIKATNVATNSSATAMSNTDGNFKLGGLAIGTYSISISKSGFQTITIPQVNVAAAVDTGLGALKLAVSSGSTTVEVTAAAPLLESTQAQVSSTVSNTDLVEFPGLNANSGLDNMAVFLPGVNMERDQSFSNGNGPNFSSDGLRGRFNDQQIDGQNNNDNSVAGPSVFVSSPLFVQDYTVITNNFGAEYGRNSGSVVNEMTKSGSNVWHGTILGTESNNFVDALSNIQKKFELLSGPPRFNDEFTGASIGGPIWKDKVFIFGGFDNEIVSSSNLFIDGTLAPTAAGLGQLQTCFPSSTAVQAFGKFSAFALGATPAPGSTTPVTVTAGATTCSGVPFANPERLAPNGSHEYDWDYRMDAVVSNNDRFFGRYLFQKQAFFNIGDAAGGYPFNIPSLSQAFLLDETHTFSSSMVNEFRASFSRANIEFGGNSLGNSIPTAGSLANALTNVVIANTAFQGFGPPVNLPQSRILSTWQGQDNWSYLQGKSAWKAGVNFTYQRTINVFFPFLNGQYQFTDWNAIAANTPASITVGTGNPNLDFREHDLYLYAGDDYKLKSNLTLNLGLTWTYFGSPENLFHTLSVKNETGPTPLFDPTLPLSVRTFPEFPSQKNLFGPSAGFAWTPQGFGWLGGGKTVVRGGFRMTVDPAYYNVFINMSTSTPLVLVASTANAAQAAGFPLPAVPTGPNVRASASSILPIGTTDPRQADQTSLPNNFGADKVREWSLGIQRQINPHIVVETRYVGNHAYKLFQQVNANPLVCNTDISTGSGSTGACVSGLSTEFPSLVPKGVTPCLGPVGSSGGPVVPNASGRENCNTGLLDDFENTAYSDYQGLQNEVRINNLFNNQLTLVGNYTWSKTTDNASETYATAGGGSTLEYAQNPFNITGQEHGLSGLDFPQQFTVRANWAVPLYRAQRGFIGHALGGWSVGASYQLVSGQTYTPIQFILNTLTGGDVFDKAFDLGGFSGNNLALFETARPFVGSLSAPASQVGIFGGDACALAGGSGPACPPTTLASTLLSFNAFNTSGAVSAVTKNQVRYIVNGTTADGIFGTPFGNAARNIGRDARTNIANITVFRTFKFNERVNVQARLDMLNAFNHPNFTSVDPFLDDTGHAAPFNGFGIPQLTGSTPRTIKGGLQITF